MSEELKISDTQIKKLVQETQIKDKLHSAIEYGEKISFRASRKRKELTKKEVFND